MANTTGSAALGNLDWSKFDFTRWDLSGLSLDPTSSIVGAMLQKVMAAPQWPKSLGSNLPALKTAVIQHLTLQTQNLQASSAALDTELASRTAATETLVTALQGKIRQSSVPPTPAPNPSQFQLVAKVVDQQSQLGLPGLTVQLIDPADPETPVAIAVTDSSGNAILSLSKQKAASLAKERAPDLTITVLNSVGASLYSAANAVCAHPNQVETHVAAVPSSPDTASAVQIATQQTSRDTTLLSSLNAKLDQLKVTYAARKTAIQTQITQIQSTIAAIQAELNSP
jgi:hypothetical protein